MILFLSFHHFVPFLFYIHRYEFASTAILPLIFSIGTLFLPESKRWEDSHSNPYEPVSGSEDEGESTPSLFERMKTGVIGLVSALMSSKVAFAAGMVLAIFQQITGINAILMYAPDIVETAGIDGQKEKLMATLCIGFWNFVTTIISFFLV